MSRAFETLSRLYLEDELLFAFSTLLVQILNGLFWGKAARSLKQEFEKYFISHQCMPALFQ